MPWHRILDDVAAQRWLCRLVIAVARALIVRHLLRLQGRWPGSYVRDPLPNLTPRAHSGERARQFHHNLQPQGPVKYASLIFAVENPLDSN